MEGEIKEFLEPLYVKQKEIIGKLMDKKQKIKTKIDNLFKKPNENFLTQLGKNLKKDLIKKVYQKNLVKSAGNKFSKRYLSYDSNFIDEENNTNSKNLINKKITIDIKKKKVSFDFSSNKSNFNSNEFSKDFRDSLTSVNRVNKSGGKNNFNSFISDMFAAPRKSNKFNTINIDNSENAFNSNANVNAIFKDAIKAKKRTTLKKNIFNILPMAIPLSLAPFFPVLAIIGTIFGSSRLVHRIFDTIFTYLEPQSKYTDFLKKTIDTYMMLPEGQINLKDRFSRAFVVSDRLIEALKPEVIDEFTTFISDKMGKEDNDKVVPEHYIENELKIYLNDNFDITPEIPLK